jgi:hypothetical protein
MEKSEIFETAKNMAIEQVLNMYCFKDDPTHPALKQLLESLLEYIMLSERSVYLAKNENDKGNGFYERNSQLLLATLNSPFLAHARLLLNIPSSLSPTKELTALILTYLCP